MATPCICDTILRSTFISHFGGLQFYLVLDLNKYKRTNTHSINKEINNTGIRNPETSKTLTIAARAICLEFQKEFPLNNNGTRFTLHEMLFPNLIYNLIDCNPLSTLKFPWFSYCKFTPI